MEAEQRKPIEAKADSHPTYMDVRAEIGISEHLGGLAFTDALHRLCHLDSAQEVLEVGCGVGIGAVYLAKRYRCRVVAIDLSEKMLAWARQRVLREGVAGRIEFRQADVRQLPFDDGRFDAVLVESVLAFVEDKHTAIHELLRVIRPGGYLGLNEVFWIRPPTPEFVAHAKRVWGSQVLTEAEWRALWEATALEERTIEARAMQAKQDFRDRAMWIGWRSFLPALGRVLRLVLTDSGARNSIREQFAVPPGLIHYMGYGLFAGRKPR